MQKLLNGSSFTMSLIIFSFFTQKALSQPVVGLDNWYNHEVNATSGKPFHYLWNDPEFSGYSRWGEIFTGRGAKLATTGRPNASVLNQIDIYIIVDPDTTTESPTPNYLVSEDINAIKAWVIKVITYLQMISKTIRQNT